MAEVVAEIPFSNGIDESNQPEVQDPTTSYAVLENTRLVKKGGVGKRSGYTALTTSRWDNTSRSTGRALFTNKGRVCVYDGDKIDVLDEANSRNLNNNNARVSITSVTTATKHPFGTKGSVVSDAVRTNGYVAYTADGMLTLETDAGEFVTELHYSPPYPTSSDWYNVAAYDKYIFQLVALPSDAFGGAVRIEYRYVDTTSIATATSGYAISATTLISDSLSVASRGCQSVLSMTTRCAIAYANNSGGTNQLSVRTFDKDGIVQSTTIDTGSCTPDCVTVFGSENTTLWVAWLERKPNTGDFVESEPYNGYVRLCVIGLNPTTLSTVVATKGYKSLETILSVTQTGGVGPIDYGPFTYDVFGHSLGSTSGYACLNVGGYMTDWQYHKFTVSSGAVTFSPAVNQKLTGASQCSRSVTYNGKIYAVFCGVSRDNPYQTTFLCEFPDENTPQNTNRILPVASVFPGVSALSPRPQTQPWVSGTSVKFVTGVARSPAYTNTTLVSVDFSPSAVQAVEQSGVTYLTGGILGKFDGKRYTEAVSLHAPGAPEKVTTVGPTLSVGWRYVAVLEVSDGNGDWVASSVSTPSANQLERPTVMVCKGVPVTHWPTTKSRRISLYRTTNGGTLYYYVTSATETDVDAGLVLAGYTYEYLGRMVTFSGTDVSDAVLQTRRQLYAPLLPGVNGSSQDRRAPPYSESLASYNGMVVSSTKNILYYSSQPIDGEAQWFSPAFSLEFPEDIVGMAAQDGNLYVFCKNSIYSTQGDPPSDNGASGGLGQPRKLTQDFGCKDRRSIVSTSLGIFFQSENKLKILSRGGAIVDIGTQIEDTLETYPVITSAVLDDVNAEVRFSLATSESSGLAQGPGADVVFDLRTNKWVSVDKKLTNVPSQDAKMVTVGGRRTYAWLRTNGTVYYENPATNLDASAWVTQKAVTGWAAISGFQGTQLIDRILLLASKYTDHDVTISIGYDYSPTYETSRTFTAADITAMGREWLDVGLGNKRMGQAIRVKIEDATPSSGSVGTGRGATWILTTLEGERRSGAKRTSTGQR